MQVSNLGLALAGGAFFALVAFIAHTESGDQRQPRYETDGNPNLGYVIDSLNTGEHYFHPDDCVNGQCVTFLPHRYPRYPGIELTALIHHGMNAMRKPAPQDDDWRTMPPGEMAW